MSRHILINAIFIWLIMTRGYGFSLNYRGDVCLKLDNHDFILNSNRDVCLKLKKESFNFGYNYVEKFPIAPWLYNLQMSGEDIFTGVDTNLSKNGELDGELSELVINSNKITEILPLPAEEFNEGLFFLGIKDFQAGNNRMNYSWSLEKDKKENFQKTLE